MRPGLQPGPKVRVHKPAVFWQRSRPFRTEFGQSAEASSTVSGVALRQSASPAALTAGRRRVQVLFSSALMIGSPARTGGPGSVRALRAASALDGTGTAPVSSERDRPADAVCASADGSGARRASWTGQRRAGIASVTADEALPTRGQARLSGRAPPPPADLKTAFGPSGNDRTSAKRNRRTAWSR
jgi:hypothetical protein